MQFLIVWIDEHGTPAVIRRSGLSLLYLSNPKLAMRAPSSLGGLYPVLRDRH
jgi:hypothetical protein